MQQENNTPMYVQSLRTKLLSMQNLQNQYIVIKFGGNAINKTILNSFAQDIVFLRCIGIRPVVIHGGGPQINTMLNALDIRSNFVFGMRVTTPQIVEVVEMVLAGQVGKSIVNHIHLHGGKAVGVTGKDGNLFSAQRIQGKDCDGKAVDIGQVGNIDTIDPQLLYLLSTHGYIPVIAPIAADVHGNTLNINADLVAGAIAANLQATRLLLLTNTAGILDAKGKRIPHLTSDAIATLKANKTISGGMLPKVDSAYQALCAGVEMVDIIDGTSEHAVLQSLCSDTKIGTRLQSTLP